jgi:hypothetical protein
MSTVQTRVLKLLPGLVGDGDVRGAEDGKRDLLVKVRLSICQVKRVASKATELIPSHPICVSDSSPLSLPALSNHIPLYASRLEPEPERRSPSSRLPSNPASKPWPLSLTFKASAMATPELSSSLPPESSPFRSLRRLKHLPRPSRISSAFTCSSVERARGYSSRSGEGTARTSSLERPEGCWICFRASRLSPWRVGRSRLCVFSAVSSVVARQDS